MNRPLDIAVVGMGCVFPGACGTAAFWKNIAAGKSAIAEVDPQRWIAPVAAMVQEGPAPDKALGRHCGLVRDFVFDPQGFRLPPEMLLALDPLYHLVLQAGREAVASGCLKAVDRKRVGTILAAIALPTDGASALARRLFIEAVSAQRFGSDPSTAIDARMRRAARVTSLPASLLAAALGCGGGSFTLDAACASSLYAVRLACDALTAGRLDAVLAGGVSRPDCLYTQVGFSQLRALSPSGRCAPFDAAADGLVVGEGAGIVVLKRLDDALAAADPVLAVIRAVGLSNDTRGNLLAPDSAGQVRAMQNAYRQAGWEPGAVDVIECHGAGTPVGDRVEIESLHRLVDGRPSAKRPCALGAVKSNIGHLLTAAGAAGLIKTILALGHRTVPPSLRFTRPADPRLDGAGPFRVQTAAGSWDAAADRQTRRAAVSAFGFGGINAHLLLEEWTGRERKGRVPFSSPALDAAPAPVAVVGMAARFGPLADLSAFAETDQADRPAFAAIPARRWRGLDRIGPSLFPRPVLAASLEDLSFPADRFRIPPNEIPDLLAQQALMLLVAADALADAGLPLRALRERMGAIVGIEFDPEATNFHVRWWLEHGNPGDELPASLKTALAADPGRTGDWLAQLGARSSPPLNAPRTVGALGGIVASRLAREFGCGGPSFGVSAEAAGGLRALEIAVRLLQQQETDLMIAGAVELTCDLRNLVAGQVPAELGSAARPQSFDPSADGTLPGEGAVALVLKRLDDARRHGDHIYAVIEGFGAAGGPEPDGAETAAETVARSMAAALREAGIGAGQVDRVEALGCGVARLDRAELGAIERIWSDASGDWPAIGAACRTLGHTGAAAGLASLMRAALCLDAGRHAPTVRPSTHDGSHRPQIACAGTLTGDGDSLHVLLKAFDKTAPALRRPAAPAPGPTVCLPVGRVFAIPPLSVPSTHEPVVAAKAAVPLGQAAMANIENIQQLAANTAAAAGAHEAYLALCNDLTRQYGQTFALQQQLLGALAGSADAPETVGLTAPAPHAAPPPAFDRAMCLEFARGKAASVLGPAFAEVDGYAARVRLPDEPLMLVDRIVSVEGEMLSMRSGKVVTEHDVRPGAWYLDAGSAPVCIAVEAGQADLFLCSYLGIDHQVRGTRHYRLLDAKVKFHRDLPRPSETIRYEIHIDRFVRQQDTWLFFFRFEGTIDGAPLISMRDGCAGFFTPEEVRRSGGIVLTEAERRALPGVRPADWRPPVPFAPGSLTGAQVEALRRGDLEAAFGPAFQGVVLPETLRLPGGRMHLVDRVRRMDPAGGRYGIGTIEAEADIAGDEWFLVCHFVDDKVMPGTLMYQCCEHTLRVFLLRTGWVTDRTDVRFQPIPGVEAVLKCRGPVTPETRQVVYRVDLREIGYDPCPYAIADALMFADGEPIVMFSGLSLKLDGLDRDAIEAFWLRRARPAPAAARPLFSHDRILAFSVGSPSEAFGERYRIFDSQRRIARLPGPPYLFIDAVTEAGPEPWQLKVGSRVTAEYDVPPEAWYFRADRGGGVMPFCILLEIALQACGFLAAFCGSALQSDRDLRFRNLGGQATLARPLDRTSGRLSATARLTKVSKAGDMIIEAFAMQVSDRLGPVYAGETTFGFFTDQALVNQVGLRGAESPIPPPSERQLAAAGAADLPDLPPRVPDDPETASGSGMPARALRMIDRIEAFVADGGPHGLGWLRGTKRVDPDEWFFAAHFFQDPVCPGSLGIEALLQLIRFAALQRWPGSGWRIEPLCGVTHRWAYRGQIVPADRTMSVDAAIVERGDDSNRFLRADGVLSIDGRRIYHLENFGLRLAADPSRPS